jgi:O-antigen/teichoic acid export membrane protein
LSLPNRFGGYGTYARLGYYYNAIALNSSLRNKFRKIWQSEFFRNAATLATGTTVAQGISIFTAPILYRIYDREDYGTLGLYMAITGVVGVFSTMQYLQVILLEKEDADAKAAMWLNRVINLAITFFVTLGIIFFNQPVASLLNNGAIDFWIYFIPVSIFFSAQNDIFRIWANRKKRYRLLTINALIMAILVPLISISYGLLVGGFAEGLFLGLLASHIIPSFILFFRLNRDYDLGFNSCNWQAVEALAKQYIGFPKYSMPANFINQFSNQLPVFMLSTYAGAGAVGVYNLTVRVLGIPINLISSAFGEVFRQRASEDYYKLGNCISIFRKTLKTLLAISILPFTLLAFLGPALFAFVFGAEWREAGEYAQVLAFLYLLRMIVRPLTYTFFIYQKQREDFIWHLWMLGSNLAIFFLGFEFWELEVIWVLGLFAVNYSLIYLIYLGRSYRFAQGQQH